MALDQVQNFVEVDITGTYTSSDTTISLESGGASEVPDPANGEYNLVWFDAKNHAKPSFDPEVEIVRVTGRDTNNDTLTVTRGQENTSAVAHDTSDADYKFLLTPTSKLVDDVDAANFSTNSVTVAGNSVTLGNSTTVDYIDLNDTGSSFPIPNSDLSNSSLTVANTSISLGGSGTPEVDNFNGNNGSSGQFLQTDGSALSFASVDTFSGDHADLTNVLSDQHHVRPNAGTLLTEDVNNNFNVDEGSIDHDSLTNFVSNEHIDHSTVSITSGEGLTGGGDITSSRTLDVDIGGQTSVTAASSDEVLIEDASDSAAKKKVTAQSIADLGGGGNVPAWEEDANSPLDINDSSSGTITLDGTYDVVKCIVGQGGPNWPIDIRVNGDTGTNYESMSESGGFNSSADSSGKVIVAEETAGTMIMMGGRWNDDWSMSVNSHLATESHIKACVNKNITSPLDSITFVQKGGNNFSLKVRVYGLEI